MKTFIGSSRNRDARSAAMEAAGNLTDPTGLIIMAPFALLPEVSEVLREKYPDADSIGVCGTDYCGAEFGDDLVVVTALFEESAVSAGVIRNLSTVPMFDLPHLEASLKKAGTDKGSTICWEYCTNNEERLVTTMNVALSRYDIPLGGGTAFGVPEGEEPIVTYNGEVFRDACVFMVIRNKSGKAAMYRENIYAPIPGGKPHLATKVDLKKREVLEFDHQPAQEVYARELGIPKSEIIDNVLKNPMGRVVDNAVYIDSPRELDPNGGIITYKQVNLNDSIYFLRLQDADRINQQTAEGIRRDFPKISLILSVNCIFRYLLYTNNNRFGSLLTRFASLGPLTGTIGGGEQYRNQHVNQTMVMAVFE